MEIRKRNGESVPFQQEKIFNAMKKAFDGQGREIGRDVYKRQAWEYQRGHLDGFRNIPLDDLREHLDELDRGKPVYVNCQTGLRLSLIHILPSCTEI